MPGRRIRQCTLRDRNAKLGPLRGVPGAPLISLVKRPPELDESRAHPSGTPPDPEHRPSKKGRFETALHRHLDLTFRVLRRTGLCPADAEDAAQDVFLIFARRLSDIEHGAERAFLVSTAVRVAADRRRAKWYSVALDLDSDARRSEDPLPDEALDRRRAQALLESVLDELPPSERDVFVLAELEELTRSEIAQCLTISEGTVASRLARARERVQGSLKRWCARARRRP